MQIQPPNIDPTSDSTVVTAVGTLLVILFGKGFFSKLVPDAINIWHEERKERNSIKQEERLEWKKKFEELSAKVEEQEAELKKSLELKIQELTDEIEKWRQLYHDALQTNIILELSNAHLQEKMEILLSRIEKTEEDI